MGLQIRGDRRDTGWRIVDWTHANQSGGKFAVRRRGDVVQIVLQTAPTIASDIASGSTVYTLPSGFRPTFNTVGLWGQTTSGMSRNIAFGTSGTVQPYSTTMAAASVFAMVACTWLTTDAWPTSLPGSPA